MKYTKKQKYLNYLLIIALSTFFVEYPNAEDIHLDLTADISQINGDMASGRATRGLLSFSYENGFEWQSGELTPLLAYSFLRGDNGSDIAMDVQGFSNIDAEEFSQWQEVGLQWQNESTYVRLGYLDANANFASLDRAGDFINASFGLTPTAFPLPTYPEIEPGLYIQHQFNSAFQPGVGYYLPDEVDGDKNTPLWLIDNCWYCSDQFRLVTGYWQLNFKTLPYVNGGFTFVEGNIGDRLNGFFLYSQNDGSHPDHIDKHVKAGVTLDHPFNQANTSIGVGFSRIYGAEQESALEIYYKWTGADDRLELKPDLQWIKGNSVQDAWILTLRIDYHIW